MRKQAISITLAAVMTGALLAGCGSNADTAATTAATGDNATAATTADTAAAADATAVATETGAAETATAGGEFKVGIVQYMDHASLNQITASVERELDAKGAELGAAFNYVDYVFNGEGDATTLNQIAAQLKDDGVDAVIAIATPTAQIMQSTFEGTDTPIIFSAVTDPVGAGLAASMDAPGANITGTSDALNTDAIMNLIFAQDPEADKIGLLYSKSEDSSTKAIADAKAFLDGKGIAYVEKTGTNTDEVSQAADALIAEDVDAIFTPTDNTVMNAELAIYEKLIDAGIPHYTGADSFALNGAFLGFGINYEDLGTMTADTTADILAGGKDPASYAVGTLDNGIATINTETAAALGYDLAETKTAFEPYCSAINETTTAQEFSE
ncbi:putative ABC transport system substrate-binding protein [Lachnospiraceae bacterium NK3A20]|nr:putative ABC transport system substrate-binding protein [Lachnospiraceae bacterium NK3A20]